MKRHEWFEFFMGLGLGAPGLLILDIIARRKRRKHGRCENCGAKL